MSHCHPSFEELVSLEGYAEVDASSEGSRDTSHPRSVQLRLVATAELVPRGTISNPSFAVAYDDMVQNSSRLMNELGGDEVRGEGTASGIVIGGGDVCVHASTLKSREERASNRQI